jgi:hypothetical protein
MSLGTNITLIGVVFVMYYTMNQIFSFYGVSPAVYDVYYYFFVFLFISALVLPREEQSF